MKGPALNSFFPSNNLPLCLTGSLILPKAPSFVEVVMRECIGQNPDIRFDLDIQGSSFLLSAVARKQDHMRPHIFTLAVQTDQSNPVQTDWNKMVFLDALRGDPGLDERPKVLMYACEEAISARDVRMAIRSFPLFCRDPNMNVSVYAHQYHMKFDEQGTDEASAIAV